VTWKNPELVQEALELGTHGNVIERYKTLMDLQHENYVYPIELDFDLQAINDLLTRCTKYDQEAINVSLKRDGGKFTVVEGQTGYVLDVEKSIDAVYDYLTEEWNHEACSIPLEIVVDEPKGSAEELAQVTDVLGSFTTSYKTSGSSRSANVANGCSLINGTTLYPGEEFSTYKTVSPFSVANGYYMAGSYVSGKVVDSLGGGICQVSSTLYYSALMADLQIVLRYAHMFDPGYMPVTGCDATVSWGGPDFAFRNSTNYPIKITTSYNDETNQLTITLLGTKTDDHYVEMTNQFLSYSERKTVYQESESVAPGTTEVEQYGHNGYAVQTYRNVYAGDGTLLRSTKEAYSDYDRADKIILVAPGELPQ